MKPLKDSGRTLSAAEQARAYGELRGRGLLYQFTGAWPRTPWARELTRHADIRDHPSRTGMQGRAVVRACVLHPRLVAGRRRARRRDPSRRAVRRGDRGRQRDRVSRATRCPRAGRRVRRAPDQPDLVSAYEAPCASGTGPRRPSRRLSACRPTSAIPKPPPTVASAYAAMRLVCLPLSYAPVRSLQERPDRARGLRDVGEQLGQRVTHRQRAAAPGLGREHIVDERTAMQNALLLAPGAPRPGRAAGACQESAWASWRSPGHCRSRRDERGDVPPLVEVRAGGATPELRPLDVRSWRPAAAMPAPPGVPPRCCHLAGCARALPGLRCRPEGAGSAGFFLSRATDATHPTPEALPQLLATLEDRGELRHALAALRRDTKRF